MKKKRKSTEAIAMPVYKPNPKAERRYSAEGMADTMMRTHPTLKAMKNHIAKAVEKAAHRAVSSRVSRGTFGY